MVLPSAEIWARIQVFRSSKHLAECFPLIWNTTKHRMLKVCSVCTITSPILSVKKATDLPFHTCHFKTLRTWPNHHSNPIYLDCLQVQTKTDNTERKTIFLFHQTLQERYKMYQFCYRAYYQIVVEIVKSEWFLSHKGDGRK